MSGIVGTSHTKSKVVGRSLDTAKAWVIFDGRSDESYEVYDSFNITTVTNHGLGYYKIHYINPMKSTDYCFANSGTYTSWYTVFNAYTIGEIKTTSLQVVSADSQAGAWVSPGRYCVMVFGD